MKHFLKKSLFLCLLSMIGVKASAHDIAVENADGSTIYYDYVNGKQELTVTFRGKKYSDYNNNYVGNVVIPKSVTYNGIQYKVTGINNSAFFNCTKLTSVIIPNSVLTIGNNAFNGCTGLISVNIPNNVTSLGVNAFARCTAITSVTIPNSVTSIGSSAFYGCTSLLSMRIPNSITNIESSTFSDCTSLTSVTIPNSVKTIGNSAFRNCKSISSIAIPNSITSIELGAFQNCIGLTSIAIPNSVTNIGQSAFSGCTSLSSFTIPNSITCIERNTFDGCTGLKHVAIPNSVKRIDMFAFYNCTELSSITIPNSVTCISNAAFYWCTGLTSITIPSSVTEITGNPFSGCSNLKSIIVDSNNKYFDSRDNCNAIIEKESNTLITGCMNTKIPESVLTIGNFAFYYITRLNSITIPNNVTTISEYSFVGCHPLIICSNPIPPTATANSFEANTIAIVPQNVKDKYKESEGWNTLRINSAAFSVGNVTQTSIELMTSDLLSDQYVTIEGNENVRYNPEQTRVIISNLTPDKEYILNTHGKYNDVSLDTIYKVKTLPITLSIKRIEATNLTITVKGIPNNGDAKIVESGFEGMGIGDEYTLEGLSPGTEKQFTYYVVCADGSRFSTKDKFSTIPVTVNASAYPTTSTCLLTGNFNVIDATVTEFGFTEYPNHTELKLTGLDPKTNYTNQFYVNTKEGGKVVKNLTFTTQALSLTPQQPKVISVGNVIVAAESNLDDEETNVGFEWRRTDWTDDFASNTGTAYLYEGMMEGYIRNLNADKLWKFRPYYLSNSGTYYYGDWVGLDPSNTSYFEPTVHTYDKVNVEGNTALVKGYALGGTDQVTVQGFKYWKRVAGARRAEGNIPSDAITVEAKGQVMTAQLNGLDFESEYCYVAFVTTSENETFYGEMQTFETGVDTSGIENVRVTEEPSVVLRFDLRGRRLDAPETGINILKMTDGTIRKVFVK